MFMLMLPNAINQVDLEAQAASTALVSEVQIVAQSQWRPARFLLPDHARVGATVLSRTFDRTPVWGLLADLSRLGPDWDAYGAEPLSSCCIANAKALLSALRPSIPSPEVTPNPNGTLTLDWEANGQTLSLELGATRFSGFWESARGIKTTEGLLGQEIPPLVAQALDALFPDTAQTRPLYQEFMIDAPGPAGFVAAPYFG